MSEPPTIDSEGTNPTQWDGDKGRGVHDRIVSDGVSPTGSPEEQLGRFLDPGTELPPDLIDEHKAVLLKPGDVVADIGKAVSRVG